MAVFLTLIQYWLCRAQHKGLNTLSVKKGIPVLKMRKLKFTKEDTKRQIWFKHKDLLTQKVLFLIQCYLLPFFVCFFFGVASPYSIILIYFLFVSSHTSFSWLYIFTLKSKTVTNCTLVIVSDGQLAYVSTDQSLNSSNRLNSKSWIINFLSMMLYRNQKDASLIIKNSVHIYIMLRVLC